MAEYFDNIQSTKVIIVDNDSTYPPLLEWYENCKYEVHRLKNLGHHAPWISNLILPEKEHKWKYGSDYYVVTDADLDITDCPKDLLEVLIDGKLNHNVIKAGLSIEIDDLPDDCPSKPYVCKWEKQYWQHKIECKNIDFYEAYVDTTFALYSVGQKNAEQIGPAIRSGKPYTAKHHPWYITPTNIDEEYKFIIKSYPKEIEFMDRQGWINHLRCLL